MLKILELCILHDANKTLKCPAPLKLITLLEDNSCVINAAEWSAHACTLQLHCQAQ